MPIEPTRRPSGANLEAKRAREEKALGDRRLYVAEMRLIQRAWQDGHMDAVRQHLESLRPSAPRTPICVDSSGIIFSVCAV